MFEKQSKLSQEAHTVQLSVMQEENMATLSDQELDALLVQEEPDKDISLPADDADIASEITPQAPALEDSQEDRRENIDSPDLQVNQTGDLADRLQMLEKRIADKEAFIQRQSHEIGQLRKHSRRADPMGDNQTPTMHDDLQADETHDPEHLEALLAYQTAAAQNAAFEKSAACRQKVTHAIPEVEALLPEMASIARADGAPDDLVGLFERQPWQEDAGVLVNLARRALQNRRIGQLEGQVAKLRVRPEEMLRKVEAAAKNSASIPAGPSSSTGQRIRITEADVPFMSDAQLERYLKENGA